MAPSGARAVGALVVVLLACDHGGAGAAPQTPQTSSSLDLHGNNTPPPPPVMTLMNDTRLAIEDVASLPNFITATPQMCLDHCTSQPYCGGIVWRSPSEPVQVSGCPGRTPSEGCCYPAPIYQDYKPITSKLPAPAGGLGFVSAIVRYAPGMPMGAATSTSFWTIFRALSSSTRCGPCSTWCSGLPHADWCMQSDVMSNLGLQVRC